MSILITGFEPFLGETINPSRKLAEMYREQGLDTLLLPVSYQKAWPVLNEKLEQKKYNFLLMLGQAGGRGEICLERVALNLIDSESQDEDGVLILNRPVSEGETPSYISELPLREWLDECRRENLPVTISNSAGTYVCNLLYYQAQRHALQNKQLKTLFVHVPYLPEQIAGKTAHTPSLSLADMKKTVDKIISLIQKP